MFIGKVEQQTGTDRETIRYYERIGLISKPERRDSGYREFNEKQIEELRFIQEAKKLGFTLNEIGELLALRLDDADRCDEVCGKAERKLNAIEEKIETLNRMKKVLNNLITQCRAREKAPQDKCVILETLDQGKT